LLIVHYALNGPKWSGLVRNQASRTNHKRNTHIQGLLYIFIWVLNIVCPTFYKTKIISNDLIFSFCIYFLLITKDSNKVISGGMSLWYVMNAWHIVVFRFERIVTKLLLIQFTFLSCALRYWRCSLKVWLCPASCVTMIFSIASIIFLFFFVYKINDRRKNITLFSLNYSVAMCSCFRKIKNINHMRLVVIAR
jgi:hypothetical protein